MTSFLIADPAADSARRACFRPGETWLDETGRYVWLPIEFRHDTPPVRWRDSWDPSAFDSPGLGA